MFKYKTKTGKILKSKKPIKGATKKGYKLITWGKDMMMKASQIIKK